jgi:AcrR family transcriptional regulator
VNQPVIWGAPPPERADAARNRLHLLTTARQMLAEQDPDRLTMDGLAERAGLGKGTVFRRFGTRAGIFRALLDDDERAFQQRVLSGPPPLGPGAAPLERLIAYGRARAGFMVGRREIARAALDGPVLLYLSADEFTDPVDELEQRIGQAWQDLVERVCRP